MLGDDGNLWIVKFMNNPQHMRVLANELIATQMAAAIGLSVPKYSVVDVSQRLIECNPQLSIAYKSREREACSSGRQFGSQFAGGMMPRQVVGDLSAEQLLSVRNLGQFPGVLAFDKWTGNTDDRQMVFRRTAREKHYSALFIDYGSCFNRGEWTFPDAPLQGAFRRNAVYSAVTGWESFEPWLTRIEQFSAESLWEIAETVPPEWYGDNRGPLEELVQKLHIRQSCTRKLISDLRRTANNLFPNWQSRVKSRQIESPARDHYEPKIISASYKPKTLFSMISPPSPTVHAAHMH
jgi:hypothetical protein